MSSGKKSDYAAFDLKSLLIPAAIVLAGAAIGAGLFLGNKNETAPSASQKTPSANNAAGAQPSPTPTPSPANPEGDITTSIDDDAVWGDKNKAKAAIVEFSDYDCPYCKRFYSQTLNQLKKNFVDTGKAIFVYRDLPLPQLHPHAQKKAEATECARAQGGDGAFFAYHNGIFEGSVKDDAGLASLAEQQGLDKSSFEACLSGGQMTSEVQNDAADAARVGITGTPGFVVGKLEKDGTVTGIKISGAQPYSVFETAVKQYL